jgi:hypothetical protein
MIKSVPYTLVFRSIPTISSPGAEFILVASIMIVLRISCYSVSEAVGTDHSAARAGAQCSPDLKINRVVDEYDRAKTAMIASALGCAIRRDGRALHVRTGPNSGDANSRST